VRRSLYSLWHSEHSSLLTPEESICTRPTRVVVALAFVHLQLARLSFSLAPASNPSSPQCRIVGVRQLVSLTHDALFAANLRASSCPSATSAFVGSGFSLCRRR
jgi:hypothetical protein